MRFECVLLLMTLTVSFYFDSFIAELHTRRRRARSLIAKKLWEIWFGCDVTSVRPTVLTQSHNANAPVFVWREVARRDAFTTEMLKNTKYKVNFYVFIGYVDKRGKKRKREKKKTKTRRRLSKVQRETERREAS